MYVVQCINIYTFNIYTFNIYTFLCLLIFIWYYQHYLSHWL